MKNRRAFLKEVCPTVAFAFFGVSFLEACSSDSTEDLSSPTGGGGNNGGGDNGGGDNGGGASNGNGFTFTNNIYTIDLTHANFTNLSQVGGWMNAQSLGIPMLFLRVSNDDINAYTNICPHQGVQTAWNYESDSKKFRCQSSLGGHNNTYPDDCQTAGSFGGKLDCYVSTLSNDGNTLTVNS